MSRLIGISGQKRDADNTGGCLPNRLFPLCFSLDNRWNRSPITIAKVEVKYKKNNRSKRGDCFIKNGISR